MIDEDKKILISLINKIKETGKYRFDIIQDEDKQSFYHDACIDNICDYSFTTPVELYDQLTCLWNRLNHKEFHELTEVITVLAFKNKEITNTSESISSYIYEM